MVSTVLVAESLPALVESRNYLTHNESNQERDNDNHAQKLELIRQLQDKNAVIAGQSLTVREGRLLATHQGAMIAMLVQIAEDKSAQLKVSENLYLVQLSSTDLVYVNRAQQHRRGGGRLTGWQHALYTS